MEKKCFRCQKLKSINDFYKNKQMADGYLGKCKDCAKSDNKISNGIHSRNCFICGKEFRTTGGEISRNGGLTCSRKCYYSRLKTLLEEKYGDKKLTVKSVHVWITRKKGQPKFCEFCKSTTEKQYDWSNISLKYLRNLSDWQRLCRKCHIKYDNHPQKRKETLIKKYGTLNTNQLGHNQYSNQPHKPI